MSTSKVLCVHGIGHQEENIDWQPEWRKAIEDGLHEWDPAIQVDAKFSDYDRFFGDTPLTPQGSVAGVGSLLLNGFIYGVGDVFHRRRGFGDISERIKWYAGMVTQWAEDAKLRAKCRAALLADIQKFQPDIVCAHSLGTLITYDLLVHPPQAAGSLAFKLVTLGSQIGNPTVRGMFGGRITEVGPKFWYNLFNPQDRVFVVSLSVPSAAYAQVTTDTPSGHDAIGYLRHENTRSRVWREIVANRATPRALTRRALAAADGRAPAVLTAKKPAPPRALLVGINDYPNPDDRLEGCVNDVFLMSSVLQETGFAADDIRVVLNDRATAQGIRERLEWLLADPQPGDIRFLYYSGHGAQIPGYGPGDTVDRLDECLVPYDFNWTRETAFTDDQFFDLYSQLPYDLKFVGVIDACHSGGIMRQGGAKVRGINPPDDIRHRMLKWDIEREMWVPREIPSPNPSLGPEYTGESKALRRLGRAVSVRTLPSKQYDAAREEFGHRGPYLPMIYQACGEGQYSYEYRHGASAYGAFTYSLARILRRQGHAGKKLTFQQLADEAARDLKALGYDQSPKLDGPPALKSHDVPWRGATAKKRPAKSS